MTRKMPAQKPGKSEQTVCTPPAFIEAVEDMFGPLRWDLAATDENHVCDLWLTPGRDSLSVTWSELSLFAAGPNYLNPPFANIAPWAKKCADETREHGHVLMLVPASVGANWYRHWVAPFADVYSIGRLTFVGHASPYPKDLILCDYWKLGGNKFTHWEWKR